MAPELGRCHPVLKLSACAASTKSNGESSSTSERIAALKDLRAITRNERGQNSGDTLTIFGRGAHDIPVKVASDISTKLQHVNL